MGIQLVYSSLAGHMLSKESHTHTPGLHHLLGKLLHLPHSPRRALLEGHAIQPLAEVDGVVAGCELARLLVLHHGYGWELEGRGGKHLLPPSTPKTTFYISFLYTGCFEFVPCFWRFQYYQHSTTFICNSTTRRTPCADTGKSRRRPVARRPADPWLSPGGIPSSPLCW